MGKWGMLVNAFLVAVNPMSGALQHLPCSGGVFDQPFRTMGIWRLMQSEFISSMPKDGITERIRGN